MDDGAHQPQHTAGALEPLQRRPFLVEAVEQLGVDRVGALDPVFVCGVAGFAREVVGVLAIHLDICAGGGVDRCERGGIGLFEESLFDDLIRLGGGGGAPLVGDSAHDVLEPLECFESVRAANFFGVAGDDLVGGVAGFGGGDRDHQQHTGCGFRRLGQQLGEGELIVEGAAGQVVTSNEGACVGDPFVDQDDGGGISRQEACASASPGGVRSASALAT